MPDAAWAVSVHPPSSSRKMGQPPVLTSSNRISTLLQRFACARLSQSCLSKSCSDFSATFTTIAFDVARSYMWPQGLPQHLATSRRLGYELLGSAPLGDRRPTCAVLMIRVLSLVFDLAFFTSLAVLILGGVENQFVLLPTALVLSGVVVQAILLRRFRPTQGGPSVFPFISRRKATGVETKNCRYCNRVISADARICRFCLTEVEVDPALYEVAAPGR